MARMTRKVKIPEPIQKSVPWKEDENTRVFIDFNRRTVVVGEFGDVVTYVPFNAEGLTVLSAEKSAFLKTYTPLVGYPAEKAAKLYLSYAANLGATLDAMNLLGKYAQVSKGDIIMATNKKKLAEEEAKKPAKTKAVKEAKANEPKPVKESKVKEPKAKTEKVDKGAKKPSAAQMFKDLIMEGKSTDQQIFHKVQEAFGLDDSKSGYVAWYRNWLAKNGFNPPPAKKG